MTALVSAVAPERREVWLGFDAPVVEPAPSAITFAARSAPAVPLSAITLRLEGQRLSVRLDQDMTADADYEVTIAGVVDLQGQPVAPPFDRARFVGFTRAAPVRRGFDLWEMLPRWIRRIDDTGDLGRFVAVLQEVTNVLLGDVDRWTDILDLERAPEPFLDAMLADLGNPFPFELDVLSKRRLAGRLIQMYRLKGTAAGIEDAIRFFIGVESRVVEFSSEVVALGDAELGVNWVLGPSERWGRYAFDVEAGRVLTEQERQLVRGLVTYAKPAHTHFVNLVEPSTPSIDDGWLLGQSDLGVVHLGA